MTTATSGSALSTQQEQETPKPGLLQRAFESFHFGSYAVGAVTAGVAAGVAKAIEAAKAAPVVIPVVKQAASSYWALGLLGGAAVLMCYALKSIYDMRQEDRALKEAEEQDDVRLTLTDMVSQVERQDARDKLLATQKEMSAQFLAIVKERSERYVKEREELEASGRAPKVWTTAPSFISQEEFDAELGHLHFPTPKPFSPNPLPRPYFDEADLSEEENNFVVRLAKKEFALSDKARAQETLKKNLLAFEERLARKEAELNRRERELND